MEKEEKRERKQERKRDTEKEKEIERRGDVRVEKEERNQDSRIKKLEGETCNPHPLQQPYFKLLKFKQQT